MICPFCGTQDTRVIDSRLDTSTNQVRRRRECCECKQRYTTYEVAFLDLPSVVKSAGYSEPFSEDKLRRGLERALEKRPVSRSQVDALIAKITHSLRNSGEKEVKSKQLGERVMDCLKELDPIAYVRFASIYLSFQKVEAFSSLLKDLQEEVNPDINFKDEINA